MNRELLYSVTKKDLNIDFFSGTGAGGQNRNKNQNCVRIRHFDSGAIVTGQSHKERKSNIREALLNLINSPKFKLWQNQKVLECTSGETIEDRVEKMMASENLKIEIQNGCKWEMVKNEIIGC